MRPKTDSFERPPSKGDHSGSLSEDQPVGNNAEKKLAEVDSLKEENERLKALLAEERAKSAALEHEIEVENRSLGFECNKRRLSRYGSKPC